MSGCLSVFESQNSPILLQALLGELMATDWWQETATTAVESLPTASFPASSLPAELTMI